MPNPAKTAYTRVFLHEGRAGPHVRPSYESTLKMDGITAPFGEVESIYVPDPANPGQFIEVDTIPGAEERATTALIGHYAFDLRSTLLRLGRIGCPNDVQLHIGPCDNLANFNEFTKAIILEDVRISTWSTDPLGALSPDERAKIDETGDISVGELYEVVQLTLLERAASLVTVELIDVVRCDLLACGDCEDVSDGCEKYYAVSSALPASPGTVPEIIFTLDGGATWLDHDVDSLTATADAIACVGRYVVVISNAAASHNYALKSEFDSLADPAFTAVTGGYVVGGEPNDIWSVGNYAFIVGDAGYIYGMADPTAAVEVLDAGVATSNTLRAVHALSDGLAVAVGDFGEVVYTLDGVTWAQTTIGPCVDHLQCVWMKDELEWWVGSDGGQMWYTLNRGVTWTEKAFAGSGTGVVHDIQFPTASIGYMTHTTAAGAGRLFRSYDGGYSWIILPEGTGTIPANDRLNAIATCPLEANIVVAVGLGEDPDGIIILGSD